ncbi:MAG: LamG domain-containing protein, partial [Planctomycetota bacterium]
MKVQYGTITILVAALIMSPAINTAEAKLLAYWKLDEMNGTTTIDSVNGIAGSFQGNPSWSGGRNNGAVRLGSSLDFILVKNESGFDITGEITVSAWVKAEYNERYWYAPRGIVTKGRDSAWKFQKAKGGRGVSFHLNCTGVTEDGLEGKINIIDEDWHHIVGVYDRTKIYLYVDGVEDTSTAASGNIGTNDAPVCIGSNAEACDTTWLGLIDDIAIFDHALNADEISQLYSKGVTCLIEPALRKIIAAIEEAKRLVKEHQFQKATDYIEKEIIEYEQWKNKNPNGVVQSYRLRSSDLYFMLAKVKKFTDVPKQKMTKANESTTESNVPLPSNYVSALLRLYENKNTCENEDAVQYLMRNNSDYMQVVAGEAELMVHLQKPKAAIQLLEYNLAAYARWKMKNPNFDIVTIDKLPEVYFQLAKAKEFVGAQKEEIADAYCKTLSSSDVCCVQSQASALIWLIENGQADRYKEIIGSFTQSENHK